MVAHNSGGPRDDICVESVRLFVFHARAIHYQSNNVLFCFKVTAEGCPGAIQPYRLCDDVGGYVDAVMR